MSAEFLLQGATIKRLLVGLGVTLRISLVSVALSIPFGVLMGVLFTRKNRMLQVVLRAYLNFIRVMPQLVLLYVVFFGSATTLGLNFSGEVASIIVFTLWGAAELGDLVRAALESIPRSQYDSSYVLGLTQRQTFLRVILPQALSRLLPPSVNLVTRIVKTTSLCMLIGVVEVVRVGQQIIDYYRFDYPQGALWTYATLALLYFCICWPLSMLSKWLEGRNTR
ncbi:MAG: amino acid ABC transporter permease [Atopobiaceae bacterium]|jgi:polar amino acid transport system permease protein|nr:amino acid ABC transporter permease [Atopobiaceae bacterium]MBQ9316340.1 amino acid ABC transporter permease [Atopobiaceae bacterium]